MFMQQSDAASAALFPSSQVSPWRDILVVALVTAGCMALAAYFELGELVFEHTRRWEHFELDEWPVAVLVLALGLMWISWRRYQQTLIQLRARRQAEERLAAALAENRTLAHQHLRIQEAERKHFARELHDELGQYLNAIKIDAVSIQQGAQTGADVSASTAAAGARVEEAADHVYGVVSDMIRRLRPVGLDELGLMAALENCLDHWRQRLPQTSFTLSASGELDDLGEVTNLTIYRLIQEGLTNSYKHAGASRIDISLTRGEKVVLTVADDGVGRDLSVRSSGFGLGGMRERVEMLGGTFHVESSPGRGFTIEARLPVERVS
jgi:two-component system sensor histidine kinase UhpB